MLGPLREGAPRQIGPYDVLARLGAGGMGEVFLGRSHGEGAVEGSYVAVKTVRRDVANEPAFRDRFRREIKVAGLVRSVYAAAPEGGDADAEVPWLATAYVPGPSLSQAVRRGGALPVATVRELGAGIARALADLHAAGVLHRDLKPGNVMLSVDGPRLIDFGIARSNGATTMTATGMMVGTPSFMSPEHVAGARHVTGASDVFCLGSLLCYAATGEDPFGDGPLAAVLYRVSRAEADLSRVPDELRTVIAACLRLAPAERPSPAELVELLGGERRPAWPESVREHIGEYGRELAQLVASGGPLVEVAAAPAAAPGTDQLPTMPPMAPTARPAAPPRRRRGTVIAVAVALAVLGAGVGTYLLWPENQKKQTPPKAAPPAAAEGPKITGVDFKGVADSSGIVPQNPAQRPAGWKPWTAKLPAPAFGCAAGTTVLVCRMTDGRYEALDPANGKKLWSAEPAETKVDDSWTSPSGGVFIVDNAARPTVHDDAVVLAADDRLQVRDARTGKVRWEKPAWGAQGTSSRPIVADGIVFAAMETTAEPTMERVGMAAYSLADGTELWKKELTNATTPRSETRPYEPVAFAKGQVYALGDGGLVAYDAKTGEVRGQVDKDAEGCLEVKIVGAVAYCPDVVLRRSADERLRVLDSATLASAGSLHAPVETRYPAVITPTAFVTFDGGLRIHDPRDGKLLGTYAAKAAPKGMEQNWSTPLIAGDQVVYADYSALYTVRLGKGGKPAGLTTTAVPGAPGPRAREEAYDPDWGVSFAKTTREPEVLPIGGIAHVVFDKGVVASVALPE
ncbi:serine/threonine-protein kinase [Streptomyces sp. Je 1-79]|uniref:serine/threonine-protein kinase n=1 Tax=Streptomyces sp. Je 1-79 TaxID=2943847 RepID=UPI0021A76685|nr:serine/threonine-protein kinase [Streptomyces sp. Je 1-79]MCT4355618.1 serine/threonine-protein kinase [Streptomyces sp. Je 1-79]